MKLSVILLTAFVATLASATAIVSQAELPTCTLLCLQTEILASSCSLTNTTCQCTNVALSSAITTCVTANCTVRQGLTTKAYLENKCGAEVRDNSRVVIVCALGGLAIATLAFVIRILSRIIGTSGVNFWWDDAVLCLAMAFVIPLSAMSVVITKHGLGKDVWNISFEDITQVAWFYYWDEFMYLISLPLTKISILCFYLRIFPDKQFRTMVFISMALCVSYIIAFVLVTAFQCLPISGAWTNWDGTFTGHCNNINAQGWASATANILLDLIVIILPLPQLSNMKMSIQKKLSVMGMFCVGFFITIVSVLRLKAMIQFGGTTNMTWDYVSVGYWSTIEVHVSIICACLPAIRALLKQLFPDLITTQKSASTDAPASGFASISSRIFKSDLEKGGTLVSSKAKDSDTDGFIPLVDVGSVNHSRSDLTITNTSDTNSRSEVKSAMSHDEVIQAGRI